MRVTASVGRSVSVGRTGPAAWVCC